MMRLAFGGNCGKPGSPPGIFGVAVPRTALGSKLASAIAPSPRAVVLKKWRRVIKNGSVFISTFPDGGVKVENGLGDGGHFRKFTRVQTGVAFVVADFNKFRRALWFLLEQLALLREQLAQQPGL